MGHQLRRRFAHLAVYRCGTWRYRGRRRVWNLCRPRVEVVRGPPGPLPRPMLWLSNPPSLTSINCTEIGVSIAGFTIEKVARKARKNSIAWRSSEGIRKGLRKRERRPISPKYPCGSRVMLIIGRRKLTLWDPQLQQGAALVLKGDRAPGR